MESRDPRQARFFLRLESGDRRGERIPLPAGTFRVGRRSANDLVLADSSVSGRHAELVVAGGRVHLVDLSSTNGTRVENERVEEADLAHGDVVVFGSVRCTLVDELLEPSGEAGPVLEDDREDDRADDRDPFPSPRPTALTDAELGRVSADRVARAGRRSVVAVLVLALSAAGAGFFLWRVGLEGSDAVVAAPVVTVEGNRLVDGSFESEGAPGTWELDASAPVELEVARSHARSGRQGLGAHLADGEWTLARSERIRLEPRRGLRVGAALWAEDGVRVVLGVELSGGDQAPTFTAWSPAHERTAGFEDVELSFDAFPGYDAARLVVVAWARGEGTVSIDDALAVPAPAPEASSHSFHEYEARVVGSPGATAVLLRSGRVVFPGLSFFRVGPEGPTGFADARWEVVPDERGFTFRVPDLPADAVLSLPVNVTRRNDATDDEVGWISTLGTAGYRSHASEFDLEGVASVLLGRGLDLLSVELGAPLAVRGRIADDVLRLEIALAGQEGFDVRLTFGEERAEANRLRREAEDAEHAGRPGEALRAWQELLDHHPYEAALVRRAETERARLVQSGLVEVGELRTEVERAKFFGLAELYRDVRRRARALAARFAGSEVEDEAEALARSVDDEIERLVGLSTSHLEAQRAVAAALEREGADGLAAHVREELARLAPRQDAEEDR